MLLSCSSEQRKVDCLGLTLAFSSQVGATHGLVLIAVIVLVIVLVVLCGQSVCVDGRPVCAAGCQSPACRLHMSNTLGHSPDRLTVARCSRGRAHLRKTAAEHLGLLGQVSSAKDRM